MERNDCPVHFFPKWERYHFGNFQHIFLEAVVNDLRVKCVDKLIIHFTFFPQNTHQPTSTVLQFKHQQIPPDKTFSRQRGMFSMLRTLPAKTKGLSLLSNNWIISKLKKVRAGLFLGKTVRIQQKTVNYVKKQKMQSFVRFS